MTYKNNDLGVMPLTFEGFQDRILKHPILGDDEWEFFHVQTEAQQLHYYKAVQPRRILHRLEVIYAFNSPLAEDQWWVLYHHQGYGKTLKEALKNFFGTKPVLDVPKCGIKFQKQEDQWN